MCGSEGSKCRTIFRTSQGATGNSWRLVPQVRTRPPDGGYIFIYYSLNNTIAIMTPTIGKPGTPSSFLFIFNLLADEDHVP